jgi:predicted NAD/FAD-binding protein
MPFDARRPGSPPSKRKIAVVGSGVSGLSAAWLLAGAHDVTLYEKAGRLGGHANTVDAPTRLGPVPVDAGFIVFNKPSYPNFVALLDHLCVAIGETCMSFAVSLDEGRIEYSGRTLSSVFARRRLLASPSHWMMLADIARFQREAREALKTGLDDDLSIADFAAARGYSRAFLQRFLEPMASAIWSTPSNRITDYPAASLFRFYDNHGLLQVLNLPKWNTVAGGSREYVQKLAAQLAKKTRLNARVARVERNAHGVAVIDDSGARDQFDDVVLATHADTALAMLAAPTEREARVLSAFRYQPNRAIMHFDDRQMPVRRRAWSSWNYMGGAAAPAVTYWMNSLQGLSCEEDIFVTLNPSAPIAPEKVIAEFDYEHPMFDVAAMKAQREIWSLQGDGGVWYCGAHLGSGFHEDGLQAGLAVAEAVGGVRRPWSVAKESARLPGVEMLATAS